MTMSDSHYKRLADRILGKTDPEVVPKTLGELLEKHEVIVIPLEKVTVDYSWNTRRSIGWEGSGGPEDRHRFEDLVTSLEESGQDMPIILRKTSDGHFLVAGFRRYAAATHLKRFGRSIKGLPEGTIRAEVREMTDLEARALNGRENIARERLSTPDIMETVTRLSRLNLDNKAIGSQLGLSPGYIYRLLKAHTVLRDLSLEAGGEQTNAYLFWRDRPTALTSIQVFDLVEKTKPEAREEKLRLLLAPKKPNAVRFKTIEANAIAFVTQLVRLHGKNRISIQQWDWIDILEVAKVTSLRTLSQQDRKALAASCKAQAEFIAESEGED